MNLKYEPSSERGLEAGLGVDGLEFREIGILLPNSQRQHRTWHIQKDELPYALC